MIYEYYQKFQKTRDIFLPLSEIRKLSEGKIDQYCSIFGYDPEDIAHGVIYGPMYFDIDHEGNLAKAHQDMIMILKMLKFYGITDQDYQVSFSGSKGFHIIIYPQVFDIKPQKVLDRIYKKIAGWFSSELNSNTIDFKVYERRRIWRIVNTLNSKSNLNKIPITENDSVEAILELAKNPQPVIPKFPQKNDVLSGWVQRAINELNTYKPVRYQNTYRSNDLTISPQVRELIDNGVGQGNRNQTAFYISCYLKSKGFSESEVLSYLETFASHCSPPYQDYTELKSTLRQAFKGGSI